MLTFADTDFAPSRMRAAEATRYAQQGRRPAGTDQQGRYMAAAEQPEQPEPAEAATDVGAEQPSTPAQRRRDELLPAAVLLLVPALVALVGILAFFATKVGP